MRVIHPSLFLIMKRFPDRRNTLRQMYRNSEYFKALCQNYQECSKALKHWTNSKKKEAPERQREYTALLQELELEIIQSLEQKREQK